MNSISKAEIDKEVKKMYRHKIKESFKTPGMRHDANVVLNLVLEEKTGFSVAALLIALLGLPAMFMGIDIGNMLSEGGWTVTSCLITLICFFTLGCYIDYRVCKYPARKKIKKFIKNHPEKLYIFDTIKDIVSTEGNTYYFT